MRRRFLSLILIVVVILSSTTLSTFAASKGKYKLPKKIAVYYKTNGRWVNTGVYTLKFNKKGDIIKGSNIAGKAKTTYWKGTRKKKKIVWTGRGYGSKEIIYYNKKGHIKKYVFEPGKSGMSKYTRTYSYSNNWVSRVKTVGKDFRGRKYSKISNIYRTFHNNGMISSASFENNYAQFNQEGLITYVKTSDGTASCRYEYDNEGNVKSLYIIENLWQFGRSECLITFTYGNKAKVSRRTQSAWINEHIPDATYIMTPFTDILGTGTF